MALLRRQEPEPGGRLLAAVLVTEEVVEGRHRLLLQRSGYVGVQVQRDADLAVSEHLADHFGMDTQLQQQCRHAVAEVMRAHAGRAARFSSGWKSRGRKLDGLIGRPTWFGNISPLSSHAVPAKRRSWA
jgi:hypothetical protein